MQNFLGEGQFRPTYYVAQENLTPVPEGAHAVVMIDIILNWHALRGYEIT